MQIENHQIDKQVFIIAEIGNNHEGDFELAKDLIQLASESGANAVKFQTIVPEKLIPKNQIDRLNQLEKYRLTYEQFRELSDVARKKEVIFLSTPFDIESALFLNEIVSAFKVSSGDNNFFPLLTTIANTGKPIIMSTGMMNLSEVNYSVNFIEDYWKNKKINQEIALLHCVSCYPTKFSEANLSKIISLKEYSNIVGYSDHTNSFLPSYLAVSRGACIVEKHITLDYNIRDAQDWKVSAGPDNFEEFVKNLKMIKPILGEEKKKLKIVKKLQ